MTKTDDVFRFVEILDWDITNHPEKLTPLSVDMVNKLEYLVGGVEVDLDKPLKKGFHWTKEECARLALKYTTRNEFAKENPNPYKAAWRKGFLDEICAHMTSKPKKSKQYWDFKKCKEVALKFNNRTDFYRKGRGAYQFAHKKGWLSSVCEHMIGVEQKPRGYWTKERCGEIAKKYRTKSDLKRNNNGVYCAAYKNGWLDEICSHMEPGKRGSVWWTKESCEKIAKKYKTKSEFKEGNMGAYNSAYKRGWLDEICKHMIPGKLPNGTWTKENCQLEALKYKTKYEFLKGNRSAYQAAYKNGWLDDCSYG